MSILKGAELNPVLLLPCCFPMTEDKCTTFIIYPFSTKSFFLETQLPNF